MVDSDFITQSLLNTLSGMVLIFELCKRLLTSYENATISTCDSDQRKGTQSRGKNVRYCRGGIEDVLFFFFFLRFFFAVQQNNF